MTALSVNLNKIALLRNSRGRDYPAVVDFAARFINLGVDGITIHPRPDERHIKRQDAHDLAGFLRDGKYAEIELNIEGYPNAAFLKLVEEIRPAQCTLVPDGEDQLTSDHGWDFHRQGDLVRDVVKQINGWGVRSALFLDPDIEQVQLAAESGAQRIELYTEAFASHWGRAEAGRTLATYRDAALTAQELGLGVNAGHDLNLQNLPDFLAIPGILEVSIGHALVVECIESGMQDVIRRYRAICRG